MADALQRAVVEGVSGLRMNTDQNELLIRAAVPDPFARDAVRELEGLREAIRVDRFVPSANPCVQERAINHDVKVRVCCCRERPAPPVTLRFRMEI